MQITMTTPTNTPTRSTDNAHEGQTAADTNRFWKSTKLPVCSYRRKRALADGLQKEVPTEYLRQLHEDWDMLLADRIFLTRKVIESHQIPNPPIGRDEKGRLWEILNVLEVAIGNSWENRIPFPVSFGVEINAPCVWLHAVWSTTDVDDPTPAITVQMPDED